MYSCSFFTKTTPKKPQKKQLNRVYQQFNKYIVNNFKLRSVGLIFMYYNPKIQ